MQSCLKLWKSREATNDYNQEATDNYKQEATNNYDQEALSASRPHIGVCRRHGLVSRPLSLRALLDAASNANDDLPILQFQEILSSNYPDFAISSPWFTPWI